MPPNHGTMTPHNKGRRHTNAHKRSARTIHHFPTRRSGRNSTTTCCTRPAAVAGFSKPPWPREPASSFPRSPSRISPTPEKLVLRYRVSHWPDVRSRDKQVAAQEGAGPAKTAEFVSSKGARVARVVPATPPSFTTAVMESPGTCWHRSITFCNGGSTTVASRRALALGTWRELTGWPG